MMAAEERDELFGTTRGRVLLLLCGGPRTVNDLMDALKVTDNAVRAQLTNLQAEGMVRQLGLRPGTRKPHVEYELTPRGRSLLPGAYEPVLRALVDALQDRLSKEQMRELIKDLARRLVGELVEKLQGSDRSARARSKLDQLQRLAEQLPGVCLRHDTTSNAVTVRAGGCPLATITADHPIVCEVLAEVLSEVLQQDVRPRCDRSEWPQCRFEIRPDERQ
jgi:predicted ArsR family transcriptional regulator